ncbi:uncharacterized protein LOC142573899 [Dermacentor variabilis]|uniref:uncharacterized protein LOC142573899 n=1 Tax=Dermacentor variabilis TaxID=34621 RepID=UPI003F5BB0EB
MLSQLCRAQLWSRVRRNWSFACGQDTSSSPNIFSPNTNHLSGMSDAFSSEEDNDYCDEDDSSDCSLDGCCCCQRCCCHCCCCCCCCGQANPAYRLPDRTTAIGTQEAMVVMQCVQLHLGGTGAPQSVLPMGALVTALYRHRDWICVQTPHGVRGFVRRGSCTPLGTLLAQNTGRRTRQSSATSRDMTLRRNIVRHGSHNAPRVTDKLSPVTNIGAFVWASDQSSDQSRSITPHVFSAADTSSVG